MLTDRKKAILKTIIIHYINRAEPISSKAIAKKLSFSPATIRNDMSKLEEMGYIEKPHTSAGRVPSTLGYRLYVNELMGLRILNKEELIQISEIMHLKVQKLDKLIKEAGKLVAELTKYTTLSFTPSMDKISIKKFEIIYVNNNNFVIIILLHTGEIKNKLIKTNVYVTINKIKKIAYILNQTITDIPLKSINKNRINIIKKIIKNELFLDMIIDFIYEIRNEMCKGKIYLEGIYNILNHPEYKDIQKAKKLIHFIEDINNISSIINFSDVVDGVSIAIGTEIADSPLSDTSILYTKYQIGNIGQGIIAIVGPQRMDYATLSARLLLFSKELSKLIKNFFPENNDIVGGILNE